MLRNVEDLGNYRLNKLTLLSKIIMKQVPSVFLESRYTEDKMMKNRQRRFTG